MLFRSEGFVETARAEDADLVILNTCHIREKASEKVYSELGRLREMKEEAAPRWRRFLVLDPGSMTPPRKLHIKSYGCQMNVYDAQRMVDTLAREGFVETASADDADLVILNTCHIREKASEKVYSELEIGRAHV